jgi:hypothetical protein
VPDCAVGVSGRFPFTADLVELMRWRHLVARSLPLATVSWRLALAGPQRLQAHGDRGVASQWPLL